MPDMARSPEHKVDICQQCGDQGFSNAFVYCVKCLEFPVHRYCLDIIPDTLDEFVRWICDKCMSKHPSKFIIQISEANQDCSKRVKKQSEGSIIGKEMQGACAEIDLAKTPHLARDSSVGKVNGGEKLDEQINQSCAKQAVGSTQDGQPSGGRPVSEIIWEGCFKICNKDYEIFDGLVAHLSIKACEKVYREATLFPPMLKLEMLPKSAIWPNSFRNSGPTDENIALYFFPANPKCERGFEYLVDILMEEEFAMKTTLTNAELLVFTSKELPRQYWRFQGKYYLWGVFRGKQPSSKGPNKR